MLPREWYQRLYLVLAVVCGSIYLLIPTFFWHPKDVGTTTGRVAVETPVPTEVPVLHSPNTNGTLALTTPVVASSGATAATASNDHPGPDFPGWMTVFPKKRLLLGLDLVGGSHLALGVDTDEALRAIAGGYRRDIRERLTKEAISFDAVSQPLGTSDLEIVLKNANDREQLRTVIDKYIDKRLEERSFAMRDGKPVATYSFKPEEIEKIQNDAVTQVLELLRTRVNTFGVSEPIIFREKSDRIVVELPGLKDPAQAIENIKRTARLEFHIVDEQWYDQHGGRNTGAPDAQLAALVAQAIQTVPPAELDDDLRLNAALVGKIPEDDAVFFEKKPDPKTKKLIRGKPYLLKRDVALTGDRLQSANAVTDKFNNWEVEIKFDADGADKFAQVTGENVHNRMAVILENVIETAPVIQDKIEGGSAVITLGGGNRNPQQQSQEAANIARVLRTGALPAPVRIEQNKTVGPSLGQDSIVKGIRASVLGVGLVFLFAWYWYRWSGFIATIALAVNAVIMLALMTLFDATLTLPGIAGIVLTTGMAVDANVLIYERIREEMRLGKTMRSAIEAGFERAFWTVVDSHMTTAVAGAVLYVYGTDQIKGFAVTLLLGIATSLFTALVISRLCFDYWTIKLKPQVLSI